jgi:threonine/homoserine/homoserine lactone efflux protein
VSATFLLTALVVVVLPGTGAILTITAGLVRGGRASIITAFGCTLGIVPHLVAAVTGAAALLRASGLAFEALKVAGVIYLGALAVLTWRDRSVLVIPPSRAPRSTVRIITSAVLANLLNPKLTIFFFAFLPQFVPREGSGQLLTMLALGGIFMALTFVVFVLYGLLAAAVRRHVIDRPAVIRHLRRIFAACFAGLGVRLAIEPR